MQVLRDSVYIIVTIGSIAMAACQPFDGSTDNIEKSIARPESQIALANDKSAAPARPSTSSARQ